jgi:RNA polymerase sigma-70 factor, ECF subfamily
MTDPGRATRKLRRVTQDCAGTDHRPVGLGTDRPVPTRRSRGRSAEKNAGPTDKDLIRAHLAGDSEAFAELVRRHRERLWAVALRTIGDREDAADALQDALVSAFRNAAGYRGEAAVTTWLHRIVVNACLDRLRRRQARPSVPYGTTEYATPYDDHSRTETRLDVLAGLNSLPDAQRAAIVLVDIQDMSVAEAAEVLGVAEGTVKSRCSRGRTALARFLRGSAGSPGPAGNRSARPDVGPAATTSTDAAGGPPAWGWGGG